MWTSVKAGTQIRSRPLGATNPLAIAIALIAWLRAPAPMTCSSAWPFSLSTPARAPATELGLDFDETFSTSTMMLPPVLLLLRLGIAYFIAFVTEHKSLPAIFTGNRQLDLNSFS